MSLKKLILGLCFLVLLLGSPLAASQTPEPYDFDLVRLFLVREGGFPDLVLFEDLETGNYRTIDIDSDENITLTIEDLQDRIYNPDITAVISLDTTYSYQISLDFLLQFDTDGDGEFDFTVHYPETTFQGGNTREIFPSFSSGSASNMTNARVELVIWRTDDRSSDLQIEVNRDNCYVQIPFDLDTDSDGIGDCSDPDNDGDGYKDENDVFPNDPDESRDSDGDGIGDNEDIDDNNNDIPDLLEVPLALCLVLAPLIIIMTVMKRMKKSKEEEGEEEQEEEKEEMETITDSKFAPKNW